MGCIGLLNAEADNHIPDITFFPDILVAHVRTGISGRLLGDNRITRIFLPFYQRSIFRKSNTYSQIVSTGCIYQLGDTVIIDDSISGPYSILVISSIRSQSRLFLRPMKHIGTAEMSPIYLPQENGRSILLIEYMVFTFIKKQAMRFISPVGSRQQMITGAVEVLRKTGFRNSQNRSFLQSQGNLVSPCRRIIGKGSEAYPVNQPVYSRNIVHPNLLFPEILTYPKGHFPTQ